jgi:hypothetical protein
MSKTDHSRGEGRQWFLIQWDLLFPVLCASQKQQAMMAGTIYSHLTIDFHAIGDPPLTFSACYQSSN